MTTYSLDVFLFLFGTSQVFHVQLFCMWLSNFPNIIYWRDCPFSIIYSWPLCHKLFDIYVGVYIWVLSSVPRSMCLHLYQYLTVLNMLLLLSCSDVSNSLQPHGLQHTRLFCLSPSPGACSLMSIETVMPSTYLVICRPLFLLPSVFPSIRLFSNESVLLIRWPKYWSFSFSISPSSEYSGLISFRIDWFDLLTIQGTLQSPLVCKEIQPVHPKGDQSWIVIGRTDVEAETKYWSFSFNNTLATWCKELTHWKRP